MSWSTDRLGGGRLRARTAAARASLSMVPWCLAYHGASGLDRLVWIQDTQRTRGPGRPWTLRALVRWELSYVHAERQKLSNDRVVVLQYATV